MGRGGDATTEVDVTGLVRELQNAPDFEKKRTARKLWDLACKHKPGLNDAMVGAGIINICIAMMKRTDDRTLQEEGALLLRPICNTCSSARKAMEMGAPALCIQMMQYGPGSSTAGYGVGLCANLGAHGAECQTGHNERQGLWDAGVVPPLMTLLFAEGNDWEQEQAADALSQIARDKSLAVNFATLPGLVPRLVHLMAANSDSDARAYMARALAFITQSSEQSLRAVYEAGALLPACAMIGPEKAGQEVGDGAQLIAALIKGDNMAVAPHAVLAALPTGVIQRLVYEVSGGARTEYCARHMSARALAEFWRQDSARSLVWPVLPALAALASRFDAPETQQRAAEGITGLIDEWGESNDWGLRNAIAQAGAIGPLVGMLQCPRVGTSRFAMKALAALSMGGGVQYAEKVGTALGQAGAVPALVSALGARDRVRFQEDAIQCLQEMIHHSVYSENLAMQANVHQTLLWLIKGGAASDYAAGSAAVLIGRLAASNPDYKRQIMYSGALPAIENLRRTGGPSAKTDAEAAVRNIKGSAEHDQVKSGGWCFCFP